MGAGHFEVHHLDLFVRLVLAGKRDDGFGDADIVAHYIVALPVYDELFTVDHMFRVELTGLGVLNACVFGLDGGILEVGAGTQARHKGRSEYAAGQ